ncbi:uncharacterized protein TNCV_578871 [Trichonephila clavipes]|nr:uncharacterized protein TNCV_578871 [Trichonephila clavipes]
MEVPLRTAYGPNGRCGMQPKAKHKSSRAGAAKTRTETCEIVEEKQKLLDIREKKNARETETRPLTTSNKFTALQPSLPLSESATTTPNSELSNTPKVPQNVKQNSKNRRKRTKAEKAEIKMAKHKPRKSGPTELTTDDEDMIMYDVQAEELEPNHEDKYAMIECFVNNPSEYMRALTPTRFRKSRN